MRLIVFTFFLGCTLCRFSSLAQGDSSKNLENRTFMKEVNALLDHRRRTWDAPQFERNGSKMKFNDFVEIKRRSQYMLHSLIFSQTFLKKKIFGEKYWREREAELRALEGRRLQDPERRKSVAMVSLVKT